MILFILDQDIKVILQHSMEAYIADGKEKVPEAQLIVDNILGNIFADT